MGVAEERAELGQDQMRGALDFTRPALVFGTHDEAPVAQLDAGDARDLGSDRRAPGELHFLGRERRRTQQTRQHTRQNVLHAFHSRSVSSLAVRLVLASSSPRRADLLRAAGFDFVVRPVDIDETALDGEEPATHVARLATAKAEAVRTEAEGDVVLAADTVVVIDGEILGKPRDEADAASMLQRLSGREHRVLTGVAVKRGVSVRVAVDETRVWFDTLAPEEVAWYVASGEPRDKAGAYAMQGLASRFVSRIEGSHTTVVGLPIPLVRRLLRELQSPIARQR